MVFESILRELKGMKFVDKKRKQKCELGHGNYCGIPEGLSSSCSLVEQNPWANMPPELLLDIIGRVEARETTWPARRAVVSCAAVCKSWREATRDVISTPEQCGLLTFPMSLKQPGPRDSPIQCFISRDRAKSTYRLYLGLTPAPFGDASKFLLAAKRVRKAMKTDFIISMAPNDISLTNDIYAGKLRSNFFGCKFAIHDCYLPCNSSAPSHAWSRKRISVNKVSPRVPICIYKAATISYELNVLRTRGPRRLHCIMHSIPFSAIQDGAVAPTPPTFNYNIGGNLCCMIPSPNPASKEQVPNTTEPLILNNKSPRWHEQLQCWCLNFRGRVTVASVKNFQLVAEADPSQYVPAPEQERVILQFGKIGKDIFTMDYAYPLSAFQAFAICLSSFDTKPGCE